MSRWDRCWFLLLGVLSASLGATTLIWAQWVDPGRRIVGEPFQGWMSEPWFPWAVAAVGAFTTLSALAWAFSQLRRGRDLAAGFDVGDGPFDAPVTIASRTTADAVAERSKLVPGVISAASRVLSDTPPTIELRLGVDRSADVPILTGRLDDQVRAALRRTLGRPDADLIVHIGLVDSGSRPVDGGTLVGRADTGPGRLHQPALPRVALPRVALAQATLPQITLPSGRPGADHSAESAAATSSGTSTLA